MLGIKKETLPKTTGLIARMNGKNGNGKLTGKLLDYLENKYNLLPHDMVNLRVVKSKGSLGKIPACLLRVYDQETSVRNGVHIRLYNDLDKRPDLILYEGYILEGGFVYITKRDSSIMCQTP